MSSPRRLEQEHLVDPGGIAVMSIEGMSPIFKRTQGSTFPEGLFDGTQLSGFVTAMENPPPRECEYCKFFFADRSTCGHVIVRIDPELKHRRTVDGTVSVDKNFCCNGYRAKSE